MISTTQKCLNQTPNAIYVPKSITLGYFENIILLIRIDYYKLNVSQSGQISYSTLYAAAKKYCEKGSTKQKTNFLDYIVSFTRQTNANFHLGKFGIENIL